MAFGPRPELVCGHPILDTLPSPAWRSWHFGRVVEEGADPYDLPDRQRGELRRAARAFGMEPVLAALTG